MSYTNFLKAKLKERAFLKGRKKQALKSRFSYIILILAILLVRGSAFGQVSSYTFAQAPGTYTPLTLPTVLFTSPWDDAIAPLTLPFTFKFNNINYTSCNVSSNGFITFGTTSPGTTIYTPISSNSAYVGAISGLGRDLASNTSGNNIVYATTGTAPNRIFVVQWINAQRYNNRIRNGLFNFQIRISESSNTIQVVYGSCSTTYNTDLTVQVGLRGGTNTDYKNRATTNNWPASTAGTTNVATCNTGSGVGECPTNGLTYTWTPPAPTLTVNPASLAFGNIGIGGTSASQSYILSGTFLNPAAGNISVSAPPGFEISLSATTGYGTSVSVPYASATLANTTIYARFKPNVANATFNDKISNSGGGATTAFVTVTGTSNCVINLPTPQATIVNTDCPASAIGSVTVNNLPVALAFANSDNDYVDLGGSFLSGRTAFTMEGWVKFNKADIRARMSLFGQNDVIEFGFIDANNFQCYTLNGGSLNVSLNTYPNDNMWHHIAVTGNGTNIRMFIDGTQVGIGGNATANYGTSTAFTPKIGSGVFDPTTTAGGGFTGQVMKVSFLSAALSQAQITSLASGFYAYTGTETGLLAAYNFYEGTGTTLTRLPIGTNGIFYNSPVWTDPFTYNWTKTGEPAYSASTKNISGLTAGQYNLNVTLPGACVTGNSFTVNSTYLSPTATISGTISVCAGSAPQLITFTGAGGTTPYTFTYTINGGSNLNISTTGSNNSVTISQSTSSAGTFEYSLLSVADAHCSQLQSGTATITATPSVLVWNGSAGNDWKNKDNWTPDFVPGTCADVTIPATATNFPTLDAAATINSIIIESGASILGNEFLSVTTKTTVERDIVNNNKWHFLSSPVAGQAIWPEFAPTPTGNPLTFGATGWNWDFYYFNPNAPNNGLYWVNLRNNDGTYNNGTVNEASSFAGFGPSVPSFTTGKGYLVAYSTAWNATHTFVGPLNRGTINMPVIDAVGAGGSDFNLLGNPYPSSIDWKAENGWTRSNLATGSGGGYDFWIFNDNSGNYGVYNSGSTASTGTLGVSQNIAPCQAFFVQANVTGTISATDEVRTHSTQQWLKNDITESNLLRLKISTDANSYYDEMIVEFNPKFAGSGSAKFWGFYTEAPEIYAVADGKNYSISVVDELTEDMIINIAAKTGIEATYTIKATNISEFDLGNKIMLEDLKTGILTDLKQASSYTFHGSAADNANRFRLIVGSPLSITEPTYSDEITVYAYENSIYVTNETTTAPYQVMVSNMAGQQLINTRLSGNTRHRIEIPRVPGVYVVTVVSEGFLRSKKVVLR